MLSERQLNRALLARQHLLSRTTRTLVEVVEDVGGLQTQYAPSGYIGAWTRVERFERDDLTAALERRQLVQATMMRSTIHTVSAADYWPLTLAIRRARREWFERVSGRELQRIDMPDAVAAAREVLADGPVRMAELTARLGERGHAAQAAKWLGAYVDLVRVPPSGTWHQRRADLYGLAEQWLGPPPAGLDEEQGLALLARRYLAAFGPASRADLATWAGLPPALLQPALERLPLRHYRDAAGRPLLDLDGLPASALPDEDVPAPVRFLPTWDALLLVHARRTQVLPERYRERIFGTRTPQSFPTLLVDGQVAGTWRYEDGEIRLSPFERLPRATMTKLAEEAAPLAELHAPEARNTGVARAV